MDLLGGTTGLLAVCLILWMAWKTIGAKKRNLPPGPTPLPLLGNLLQLRASNAAGCLQKMSEKHGPVFTVYFGLDRVVVLHGFEVVKKILVDGGDEFLNRGSFPSADKTNRGLGILMANWECWLQICRFSLTTLRNLEWGRKALRNASRKRQST